MTLNEVKVIFLLFETTLIPITQEIRPVYLNHTWLVLLTVLSKLNEFLRSQAVTYFSDAKDLLWNSNGVTGAPNAGGVVERKWFLSWQWRPAAGWIVSSEDVSVWREVDLLWSEPHVGRHCDENIMATESFRLCRCGRKQRPFWSGPISGISADVGRLIFTVSRNWDFHFWWIRKWRLDSISTISCGEISTEVALRGVS